jgi:hypothetical protein
MEIYQTVAELETTLRFAKLSVKEDAEKSTKRVGKQAAKWVEPDENRSRRSSHKERDDGRRDESRGNGNRSDDRGDGRSERGRGNDNGDRGRGDRNGDDRRRGDDRGGSSRKGDRDERESSGDRRDDRRRQGRRQADDEDRSRKSRKRVHDSESGSESEGRYRSPSPQRPVKKRPFKTARKRAGPPSSDDSSGSGESDDESDRGARRRSRSPMRDIREVILEKPEKWASEDKLKSFDPLKVSSHIEALKNSLTNFGRSPAKRVDFIYSSLSKDIQVQVRTGMLGKKAGEKNVLKVIGKLARGLQVPGYQPGFQEYIEKLRFTGNAFEYATNVAKIRNDLYARETSETVSRDKERLTLR